jgi:uncharacterized OB-fold protein
MSTNRSSDIDRSRIERYFVSETVDTEPQLVGSRCSDCNDIHFPSVDRCPECFGSTRDHPLSRTGSLYAFSTVSMGPPSFDPPYTIGYVDLPDGVRVFTKIDAPEDRLSLDQKVAVAIDTIAVEDGVEFLGYLYRPMERSQ